MMDVYGIVCPRCGDFIYSRARHDFHSCSCGGVSVDGGFDYLRGTVSPPLDPRKVKNERRTIPATQQEMYQDWNYGTHRFGRVPGQAKGAQLMLFSV